MTFSGCYCTMGVFICIMTEINIHLCRGGNVIGAVCLFVSGITQKVIDGLLMIFVFLNQR